MSTTAATHARGPAAYAETQLSVGVEGVTISLGRTPVVRGATFTAPKGTVTALIGPNGSGKTTVLRSVIRAVAPDTGQLRLGEEDLLRLSRRQAAAQVSAVVQEPVQAAGPTVREVVSLGRLARLGDFGRFTAEDRAAVVRAMEAAEVSGMAERDIATLSGGERQRVQVARALAQQTPVLVMDEPTNHLDIHHQLELLALLDRLASEGHTVLVALHDLTLAARWCGHIVLMNDGGVVVSGDPRTVLVPENVRPAFRVDVEWLRVAGQERLLVL
ncbi:ABC transporter ATP-binding protein [Arthrobacter tecti]